MHTLMKLHICFTTGFSSESLEEWKEFLWLAIPGMFVVGGEWWAYEIGSFVTGSVDGVQLAAFTITLNIVSSGFVVRKSCTCVSCDYILNTTFQCFRIRTQICVYMHTHA